MSRCIALQEMNEKDAKMTLPPTDKSHSNGIGISISHLPEIKDSFPPAMNGLITKCVERPSCVVSENGVGGEDVSLFEDGSGSASDNVSTHSLSLPDTNNGTGETLDRAKSNDISDVNVRQDHANGPSLDSVTVSTPVCTSSSSFSGSSNTGENVHTVSPSSQLVNSSELCAKTLDIDSKSNSSMDESSTSHSDKQSHGNDESSMEVDCETQTAAIREHSKDTSCSDKDSSEIEPGSLPPVTDASNMETEPGPSTDDASASTSTRPSPLHPACSTSPIVPCLVETELSLKHVSPPSSCDCDDSSLSKESGSVDANTNTKGSTSPINQETTNNDSSPISIKSKTGGRISVLHFIPETISPTLSTSKECKHSDLESSEKSTHQSIASGELKTSLEDQSIDNEVSTCQEKEDQPNGEVKPDQGRGEKSGSENINESYDSVGVEDAFVKPNGTLIEPYDTLDEPSDTLDEDALMEDPQSLGINETVLDDKVKDADNNTDTNGQDGDKLKPGVSDDVVKDRADDLSCSPNLSIANLENGMSDDTSLVVEADCGIERVDDCTLESLHNSRLEKVEDSGFKNADNQELDTIDDKEIGILNASDDVVMMQTETGVSGDMENIDDDAIGHDKGLKESSKETVVASCDGDDVVMESLEDRDYVDVLPLDSNGMPDAGGETGTENIEQSIPLQQDKQLDHVDKELKVKEWNVDILELKETQKVACEKSNNGQENDVEMEEKVEGMGDLADKEDKTELKANNIKINDTMEEPLNNQNARDTIMEDEEINDILSVSCNDEKWKNIESVKVDLDSKPIPKAEEMKVEFDSKPIPKAEEVRVDLDSKPIPKAEEVKVDLDSKPIPKAEEVKVDLDSKLIPKADEVRVDTDGEEKAKDKKSCDNSEKASKEKLKFKNILQLKKNDLTIQQNDSNCNEDDNDAIIIDDNDVILNEEKIVAAQKPNENINNSNKGSVKQSEEMPRKRIMSSDDLSDLSPKRSRLDSVITKLGDHIGTKEPPEEDTVVLMDSDEEDDKAANKPAPQGPTVTNVGTKEKLGLTVTSAALRSLILASLKTVIVRQKVERTQQMEDRMTKMESANTLWKESAKHLEKSVEELTKFSKEIDKRRSQSQKLKMMASRNVGVQVSVGVPNNMASAQVPRPVPQQPPSKITSQPTRPNNQPPKANNSQPPPRPQHRSSAALTLPPSFRINHDAPASPKQGAPVNNSPGGGPIHRPVRPGLAGHQHQQIRGGGAPMPPNSSFPSQRLPRNPQPSIQNRPPPPYPHHIRPPGSTNPASQQVRQSNVVNLIDLTDEDDSTKRNSAPNTPKNISPNVPRGSSPKVYPQGGRVINSQHKSPSTTIHYEGPRNLTAPNAKGGRQGTPGGYTARMGGPGTAGRGGGPPQQANTIHSVKSNSSIPSGTVPAGRHPAPFPKEKNVVAVPPSAKLSPPKPSLKISRVVKGIVLSWNMPTMNNMEVIASYQLFAYQESSTYPSPSSWKKVGDVKALPLPMACTLTQFQEGNKYYFAVRAVDQYGRWGEYSDPSSIYLYPDSAATNQSSGKK